MEPLGPSEDHLTQLLQAVCVGFLTVSVPRHTCWSVLFLWEAWAEV